MTPETEVLHASRIAAQSRPPELPNLGRYDSYQEVFWQTADLLFQNDGNNDDWLPREHFIA